jgi:hypothetical protein
MTQRFGSRVESDCNRNEYQKYPGCEGGTAHKSDDVTAICEPSVQKNIAASMYYNTTGLHGLLHG